MIEAAYKLLPAADEDLIESMAYLIVTASEEVALRLFRATISTADLLAQMPGIGRHCRFKTPKFNTVRRFRTKGFESWLIFYRATADGIEVVRILHAKQNWARLFA